MNDFIHCYRIIVDHRCNPCNRIRWHIRWSDFASIRRHYRVRINRVRNHQTDFQKEEMSLVIGTHFLLLFIAVEYFASKTVPIMRR